MSLSEVFVSIEDPPQQHRHWLSCAQAANFAQRIWFGNEAARHSSDDP